MNARRDYIMRSCFGKKKNQNHLYQLISELWHFLSNSLSLGFCSPRFLAFAWFFLPEALALTIIEAAILLKWNQVLTTLPLLKTDMGLKRVNVEVQDVNVWLDSVAYHTSHMLVYLGILASKPSVPYRPLACP